MVPVAQRCVSDVPVIAATVSTGSSATGDSSPELAPMIQVMHVVGFYTKVAKKRTLHVEDRQHLETPCPF